MDSNEQDANSESRPLYTPPSEWRGRIGRTRAESEPHWPDTPAPAAGTPDVVVMLLDDTGFAHLSCYGGEIPTPNMDRLAAGGLRFNSFYTTALCSPTRASLLTGRNHHSVGMRGIAHWDSGFPHMTGAVTPQAATIAEILQRAGFSTLAAGKWHLTPVRDSSPAGAVQPLAARQGVRPVLRLPAGRDRSVPSRTLSRQPIHLSADDA